MPLLSEVQFAKISAAGLGDNTIVAAGGAGQKIRVVGFGLVAAGAVVAKFQSGAAGTDLTGPMTLATGIQVGGDFCPGGYFETAAATLLNLNLGTAVQVSGWLAYVLVG